MSRKNVNVAGATQYQDRFYYAAEQRVLSKDISELCGRISAFQHRINFLLPTSGGCGW